MGFRLMTALVRCLSLSLLVVIATPAATGRQTPVLGARVVGDQTEQSIADLKPNGSASAPPDRNAAISAYADPVQGASSTDLVRRALSANAELAAVRLDIERGRARLRQAGLRPNPSFDFEQTTGRLTGSAGERETSVGFALPLELGGKRQRRIDRARAELEAAEAEVADRERRLASAVRTAYAEAMAALRELDITENLNNIDLQTAQTTWLNPLLRANGPGWSMRASSGSTSLSDLWMKQAGMSTPSRICLFPLRTEFGYRSRRWLTLRCSRDPRRSRGRTRAAE